MSDLDPTATEPAPAAQDPQPSQPSEDEAWAQVLAAWGDEAVHRAYLARFVDLEGLAMAGGRYKAVLAERPDDAMAARMRGEVVKKAMVYGMAALPRTRRRELPRWARRLVTLLALLGGAAAVGFAAGLVRRLLGVGS